MDTSRWIWAGVSAGTAVAAAFFAYGFMPKTVKKVLPENPPAYTEPAQTVQYAAVQTAAAADEPQTRPAADYLLRIDGNTISVYREGEHAPLETYELPAGALPDYDRILLEYGIRVHSEAELHALLEDYLS